jgi:hypothetical protein
MFSVTDTQCVLYDLYIIQESCFKELKAVHYYFMCTCLFHLIVTNPVSHDANVVVETILTFMCLTATILSYDVAHRKVRS